MRRTTITCILCVLSLGGAQLLAAATRGAEGSAAALAERVTHYLKAFNRHSVDDLAALVHPEIEVYYVSQEGRAELGSKGREALVMELRSYFTQIPDVRSKVADEVVSTGNGFVSYVEQVSWTAGDGAPRTQSSLAVLQFEAELLRRVWYYPASREAASN